MIHDYEKLNVVDVSSKPTGLTCEVNWNPEDAKSNECKVLRLCFPDGTEHFVKKEQFLSFLWLIGTANEQTKMIPQVITKVHSKETVFGVKAQKNIAKGEMINFAAKVDFECPYYREEVIGTKKGKSQLALP